MTPRGAREIERKFLVREELVPMPAGPGTAMRQGYLVAGESGEARLRDAAGALTLTVKTGAGLSRGEYEVALERVQFDALWPATAGRRVEKVRRHIEVDGGVAELDVYSGDLAGLSVVEVEFASEADAGRFTPPAWFGLEVTGDVAYANAVLALRGRPVPVSGSDD